MLAAFLLVGCIPFPTSKDSAPGDTAHETAADSSPDTQAPDDTAAPPDCPEGVVCIDHFPWSGEGDTTGSTRRDWDAYGCAPSTDESGTEVVYRVTLREPGFFAAVVDELADGVDVDAHLLRSLDPDDCVDRGNHEASGWMEAGEWWVVVDTYVSDGAELPGPYSLQLGHTVPPPGDCAMESGWMDRVGDDGDLLEMPATGPVVLEAHLVTVDDGFGSGWPTTQEQGLTDHYATSQATTGFVMWRDEPWAPQESCQYGQGSYGGKLPVEDEGWYVNMYWADAPDPGTRMILRGADGRAVVVAAGYETGPGDLSNIGGTTEEVHRYLGTVHESVLTLGFAVDQGLPLGPIACEE